VRPYAKASGAARSQGEHSRDQRYLKRWCKRGHSRKRYRFYDLSGGARLEQREIVRAELAEWREGLAAEASEQAAADLRTLCFYDPHDDLLDTLYTEDLFDGMEFRKEREVAEAWYEHETDLYREEIEDNLPIPWWEEQEALAAMEEDPQDPRGGERAREVDLPPQGRCRAEEVVRVRRW
jgi:hypothetical protein